MASNSELPSILDSLSIQDLLSTIRKKAKTGNKDVVSYIRAIFQGSNDNSDSSENRRFETFKCSLSLLELKDFPPNLASELLSLLIIKVDLLQTSNLVLLCEMFVEFAKNSDKFSSKWLEMFAKVLTSLTSRDFILYQGKDLSGSELRQDILKSLFSDSDNASGLIQIAAVLKDVELHEDEVNLIVGKLLKLMSKIELVELPTFIYNLLLFASKGKCHYALQTIISHFIENDKKMQQHLYDDVDSEELVCNQEHVDYRQTEGTVILMISVVCRHDQKVGREFLLLLKQLLHKPHLILSPFTFSTALSLTKIDRIADEIFDTLKKSVVAAFQHNEKQEGSVWFRNLIQWEVDILKLVKQAIRCSKFGWDHVCQGLVKFGFVALDAFGPRCIGGNITKGICPEGCDLGSHILRDAFKSHRLVRQEIFEQILNRIIAKSQKPVSHYIDILSQIVRNDPLFLLDVLPKLVEVLDCLHFLPHSNAEKVLKSLAPLLKISAPLKDTLMLVLRKALFHRDLEARKVAVCGYLTILKKLGFTGKVSLSQSQTSMTSHGTSSSMISTQMKADAYISAGNPTAKTMCLEIMGLLKRVLMQQSEVTQMLYEGLYDVVLQNPTLKDIILELLLGQFEKYYNYTESEIPIHFSLCFQSQKSVLVLKEPFADLICVIHLILYEGSNDTEDEEYDQSAQKILENLMQKLLERMLVVDDTDFHIGKDVDFEESPAEYNMKMKLLLNIYESLLEYSFVQNREFEPSSCQEFLKLYRKYKSILDSIAKKKQQGKSSKAKTQSSHNFFSHVTLQFVSKVMEALFSNETFKHQEGLNILRDDSSFVTNIVSACNLKIAKMCDSGQSDGFSCVMKPFFNYMTILGKVMMKTYSEGLGSDFSFIDWKKMSSLLVEGLSHVFSYIHAHHSKNMDKFIINLCSKSLSTPDALLSILKSIQRFTMKLLSDTEDDNNLKDCVPLLSIIKTLYDHYMSDFKSDVYKWLKQLCSQQVFQNVSVSKAFISLCFSLGHQDENFLIFLREVAFDIRYHLGNIDPDESVAGIPKYDIITIEVAKNIIPVLFANLEKCFDEIEWILNFTKVSSLGGDDSFSTSDVHDRPALEQGVCSRVSDVLHIFSEIVQTGVTDHLANNVLKLVARLYKILTALTRYYLLIHKTRSCELHPSFEKLVKLSNTKLTPQVYAFITFIQMLSGEANIKTKKTKGNVGAFKAVRDVKTIPSLVFEIESFEKNLIILSKKYKKDLTNKMKLSTARDFRINAAVVSSVLEQQENEPASTSAADETTNENDTAEPEPTSSPQNAASPSSLANDQSGNEMSVEEDSGNEDQNENEPMNTSLNIFGESVPEKRKAPPPEKNILKVQLNVKKKRLGIRRNAKQV